MRLIDADALKAHIMEFACDPCKKYGADRDGIRCPFCNTGNLLAEIDEAPTVDAVEVVRCHDCKYAHEIVDVNCITLLSCNYQNAHGMLVENHGYCKWGERRETKDAEIHNS